MHSASHTAGQGARHFLPEESLFRTEPSLLLMGIFSGTIFGGKSTTLEYIHGLPQYLNTDIIKMDEIRLNVFNSNRPLLKTEHVFKNEATRFELKKKIISERPRIIFSEMVMLTRKDHQKPLVDMVIDTKRYLQCIHDEERVPMNNTLKPSDLDLRVILFFCDTDAVVRRIQYRNNNIKEEGRGGLFRITWEQWVDHMQEFEIPVDYEPLLIDTSDESLNGIARNQMEALRFLSGEPVDENINNQRRKKLQAIIDGARQKK